jgi:hypothetical protein
MGIVWLPYQGPRFADISWGPSSLYRHRPSYCCMSVPYSLLLTDKVSPLISSERFGRLLVGGVGGVGGIKRGSAR